MLSLTVVDALLVACLVASVHCAPLSAVSLGRDAWLEDFEKIARQNGADSAWMQADSPFSSNKKQGKKATPSAAGKKDDEAPRCPRVTGGSTSCAAAPPADHIHCRSDDDCTSFSGRKCCHDGCRLACLVAEPPPPYIDWKYEPRLDFAPGNSWLIRGLDEESEVDWCSTSYIYDATVDEEPLLCPHGYVCQLDNDDGRPQNATPNRGRCVRRPPEPLSDEEKLLRLSDTDSRAPDGKCVVSSDHVYSTGDTFRYGQHMCKCEDGSVMCRVGKNSDLTLPIN